LALADEEEDDDAAADLEERGMFGFFVYLLSNFLFLTRRRL
jgi:hypothetical protein